MTVKRFVLAAAAALMPLIPGIAAAQQAPIELKIATYVAARHAMSEWIERWANDLTERSGGRLKFTILHGGQMGPTPRYYDIARTGQADIAWFLHGATPGRFPLAELANLPFVFCSAEHATRALNDPELRRTYLDGEHKGVRVLTLFAHPPGHLMTREKPVTTIADMGGLATRPASATIAAFVATLGAKPVGLPPDKLAEGLQKGTLDAALIDYGGGGIAFQLGPFVKHVTEAGLYVTTFGFGMNEASYAKLPDDLKRLIDASMQDRAAEIGRVWDGIDAAGKAVMQKAGMTPVTLTDEAKGEMKRRAAAFTQAHVQELDGKGQPATAAFAMLQAAAARERAALPAGSCPATQ